MGSNPLSNKDKFLWNTEDIVIERRADVFDVKSTYGVISEENPSPLPISRAENVIRMTYEIAMGYTWGHEDSLIEQTEENKAKWERMEHQARIADERGWVIEMPFDL